MRTNGPAHKALDGQLRMVPLTALWLSILLSAVLVFIASFIMHMVLPYHRGDYKQLPAEEQVPAALRSPGVKRGLYMFPFCTHNMKSPASVEKQRLGPVGTTTVFPTGPVNMPKYLAMWFVYCLLIGVFVAYLTGRTASPEAPFLAVLRVAGTAAFLALSMSSMAWFTACSPAPSLAGFGPANLFHIRSQICTIVSNDFD